MNKRKFRNATIMITKIKLWCWRSAILLQNANKHWREIISEGKLLLFQCYWVFLVFFPIFILKIVALENAVKFRYSEKATKFWKKSSNFFDFTKECQIRSGHFFQNWPSQNIWTLIRIIVQKQFRLIMQRIEKVPPFWRKLICTYWFCTENDFIMHFF